VSGCCLLIRKDCFDAIAGLDNDFFLYYEDVDLCRRARARGWTVWHEPHLRVVHHQPLHRRRVPPVLRLVVRHSLLTYAARHWPRWQFRVLAGIVRLEGWVRGLLSRCRRDRPGSVMAGEQAALAVEMARGDFHAGRRRLARAIRRQERAGGLTAHYNIQHHATASRLHAGHCRSADREASASARSRDPQPGAPACLASLDG
jgi:hypothetical protein